MLQQTRVDTALPYYRRFLRQFPSLHRLACAPEPELFAIWAGLGYYRRAANLHETARIIDRNHRGRFPHTARDLARLPGIGTYTAAAIASICFGEPVPVLDGNVDRVFSRFLSLTNPNPNARRNVILPYLCKAIGGHEPGTFNQAMMELGALVCLPRKPCCDGCPLRKHCRGKDLPNVTEIPTSRRQAQQPVRHCVTVAILTKNCILLKEPASEGMLHGLWTLPGMLEPATASVSNARRLTASILRCAKEHTQFVGVISHTYSHFQLQMNLYTARIKRCPSVCDPYQWQSLDDLPAIPTDRATRKAIARLSNRIPA